MVDYPRESGVGQELLSASIPHYPATIMQETPPVFYALLNAEEVCMYTYTCKIYTLGISIESVTLLSIFCTFLCQD